MAPGPGPGEEKQSRAGGATKEGREAVCVVVTTPVAVEVVCVAALGVFVRLTPLKKGAVGLVRERRGERKIGGEEGTTGPRRRWSCSAQVTKNSGRGGSSTAALQVKCALWL